MRVFFITKNHLITAGAVLVLIISFLGFSLVYYDDTGVASRMTEPIYQGNTGKKVVAITVNVDWGEEFIPDMLTEFAKYDAEVTFFVTGRWAEKNPKLLKKMSKAGHSIQNHGYKHIHFNSLSSEQAVEEIKKAEKVIYDTVGKKSEFFASPYGEQNRNIMQAVSSINYDLIMWSVDTIDWQRPSPETIVKRVINKVHNDAIILMHPTEPTVKALPDLLGALNKEGYDMITIDKIIVTKDGDKKENDIKSE